METGGATAKAVPETPVKRLHLIYMGKKNLMAGGAPFSSVPGYLPPGRIETPVLSTFLALPNAIFKAPSRNSMTPDKQ